jgi:peptidoglycan/xylan/chitin deacetylase (PgdA/CDA1 family)
MDSMLQSLGGSKLFRPGSGLYDERIATFVQKHGYRIVLGSVYPFDAQLPSANWAEWYIREHARAGAVLILHDGPERGRRTAEVLRRVLPELKQRGFQVVTVSELLSAGQGDITTPAGAR